MGYPPQLKGRGLAIIENNLSGGHGLYLLFRQGSRPDRHAIRSFVGSHSGVSISHDPLGDVSLHLASSNGESVDDAGSTLVSPDRTLAWVELLQDGMTFELSGLSPGSVLDFPSLRTRFDFETIPDPSEYEVLRLAPGHHLTGGERTLPVAKGLLGLARDLIEHFDDLEGIGWPASSSAIGRQFFESIVTAWLEGGPFPALGLTSFHENADGALQTEGLSFWIDQELRIEPPLSLDKVSATRIGVRLVNQLVLVGGVDGSERVVAPDGTRLVLRTSRNGKFVRVWRE